MRRFFWPRYLCEVEVSAPNTSRQVVVRCSGWRNGSLGCRTTLVDAGVFDTHPDETIHQCAREFHDEVHGGVSI